MQDNYYGGQNGGQPNFVHKQSYTVDMVFCIDATGSMEDDTGLQDKIINMVKKNALHFYDDFCLTMSKKRKLVQQLRVRVVAFGITWRIGEGHAGDQLLSSAPAGSGI